MARIILSVATNAMLPNLNALVIPSVTAIIPNTAFTASVAGQAQAIPALVPNTGITTQVPGQGTAIPANVPSGTVIAGLNR